MTEALAEQAETPRTRNGQNTICKMDRDDRFLAVRPFLHKFVIVRASRRRTPSEAENYTGVVRAIGWGVEASADTLVLVPTGPKLSTLPVLAIALTRILSITQLMEGSFNC